MVDLEFYIVDSTANTRTKLNGNMSFGNMFKGTNSTIPIAIYNNGDTTAVSPILRIEQYENNTEAHQWKSISFDANKDFVRELNLDDIKPHSWLKGKDVQFENFNNYPEASGTQPDQSWVLWEDTKGSWNVYSDYLQHYPDSIDGRAMWTTMSTAKDFTLSMKITVRNEMWAGCILRNKGDSNTGYIVIVQGQSKFFDNIPTKEGVIQVWKGKFTDGIDAWTLLYQSGTIGIRSTHDPFQIRITDNKFEFWYNKDFNTKAQFTFVDKDNTYTSAAKPILCCSAGFGSDITYFDDYKMTVENDNGIVYVRDDVTSNTTKYGIQQSLLNITYGDEDGGDTDGN